MHRLFHFVKTEATKLVDLKDQPHAIAGGVAVGMFLGFTPLFGLKTVLAFAIAWCLRYSRIAALVSVSLHDILTPLWPLILTAEYDMGRWILKKPHGLPEGLRLHHLEFRHLFEWTTIVDIGVPVLLGSMFFSIPAALIAYPLVFRIVQRRAARRMADARS